jgi:hypothetical protein
MTEYIECDGVIWKPIDGYDGLYDVSSDGRVRNRKGEQKALSIKKGANTNYREVSLCKDGNNKQVLVHRLVAETFLQNPQNLPQINHKDENKENNCVENLEWCDTKYNINYGGHNENVARSHCKKVYCVELDKVFESAKLAAMQLGISDSNIAKCCKGKYKTTGGYHWEYADDNLVKEMVGE